MNKTRQKTQFSADDSENSFNPIVTYKLQEDNVILPQSQSHFEHVSTIPNSRINHVASASYLTNQQYNNLTFNASDYHLSSILTNSYPQQASNVNANNVISLHYSCQYDPKLMQQPLQQISQTKYSPHRNEFFYQPYNDVFNYHIKCEKISLQLLNCSMQLKANEYIFYYQQQSNNQIYRILCEIVSPNYLNKNFYGIEIEPNMEQKQLVFTFDQQENLKLHLSTYLSNYIFD
jgi:hypothetical protein